MISTKLFNTFTQTRKRNNLTENRLLAALTPKEFRELAPDLERVSLTLTQILYESGDVIRHVYFPLDSLVSLLSKIDNRSTLEASLVGNEGMTGIGIFLGVKASRFQAVVQGAGIALRMKTSDLRRQSEDNYRLKNLLQLYTHAPDANFAIGSLQPFSRRRSPPRPLAFGDARPAFKRRISTDAGYFYPICSACAARWSTKPPERSQGAGLSVMFAAF